MKYWQLVMNIYYIGKYIVKEFILNPITAWTVDIWLVLDNSVNKIRADEWL